MTPLAANPLRKRSVSAPVLELAALSKGWPGFTLGPISATFAAGRAYGVLGENGAGKTTLLGLIAQQLRPTAGTVRWNGEALSWGNPAAKRRVTLVRETPSFYQELTIDETLRFAGSFHDRWDAALAVKLARRFQLDVDKPVRVLSRGMRVKLGILLAVVAPTEVVLLDEPTSGLDPLAREELYDLLHEVRSQRPDLCLLLSSHLFDDVHGIADETVILGDGQTLFRFAHEELSQLCVWSTALDARVPAEGHRLTWSASPGLRMLVERGSAAEAALRASGVAREIAEDVVASVYRGVARTARKSRA